MDTIKGARSHLLELLICMKAPHTHLSLGYCNTWFESFSRDTYLQTKLRLAVTHVYSFSVITSLHACRVGVLI